MSEAFRRIDDLANAREVNLPTGGSLILSADAHEEMVAREAMEMSRNLHVHTGFNHFGHVETMGHSKHQLAHAITQADSAIAARAIAERVSSIPLHAHKDTPEGETVLDPDTALEDLLLKPHPVMSMSQLMYFVAWTLAPAGEAYLQVIHGGPFGIPTQLWPLPFEHVTPKASADSPIDHYEVRRANGTTVDLPVEEVVYFWFPDPMNPTRGLGRLAPQATRWNTSRAIEAREESLFKRDATPRHAFVGQNPEVPQPGKDDLRALRANWINKQHRIHGTEQGTPIFAPSGFNIHEFGEPDLGSEVELQRYLSEVILKAAGVPEAILGVVKDVNRANTEGIRLIFDLGTITGMMTLIVDALNVQLTPQFSDKLRVQHDEFVEPDKRFALEQEIADLQNKVRSPDEVRLTRPELEESTWGKNPVGTINEGPYTGEAFSFGFQSESASDLGDTPREGPAVEVDPLSPRGLDGGAEYEARAVMRAFFSPEAQWNRNIATEMTFVGTMQERANRVLRRQFRSVSRELKAKAERAIADVEIGDIFNPNDPKWAAEWVKEVGPAWNEVYVAGGQEVAAGLELSQAFELTPTMVNQISENLAALVRETGSSTWTSLDTVLKNGIRDGLSTDSIAARMSSTTFSKKRARVIARTEVGKANQQGQLKSMEDSQVVDKKRWNTSQDAAVRGSHRIDGQTVLLVDSFVLGSGSRAKHPLDPALPASDSVNCRCFVTPVIGEPT